jgi:membrane protease YdiL (CAAX protease family)
MNPKKEYPGFWHAVLLCVAFLGLQTVLIVPFVVLDMVLKWDIVGHPAVLGCVNILSAVGVVFMARLISRKPVSEFVRFRPISPLAIVGTVIACAGMTVVMSEADNLMRFVLPTPRALVEVMRGLFSSEHFWASGFVLVLVAPVTEEIVFRGVILRGFLRRFTVPQALLCSALLFGAIHLNPWQFVSASGLGVLFAWWFARTRSLVPSLIGHALVNSMFWLNPTLPFKVRGFNAGDPFGAPVLQPWWFDLIGVTLLAIGVALFKAGTPSIPDHADEISDQASPPVIEPAATVPSGDPSSME